MKNIIIIIIALFYHLNINAVTLEAALTNTYNQGNAFQSIQNVFNLEIEAFSQALAGFMPKIAAKFTTSSQKRKDINNSLTTKAKAVQRNLNITQPIFSGGSSIAALKSAQASFRKSRGKYYAEEQKVFLNVVKMYLKCYAAKEKYLIAETSFNSNKKQLDAVEERLKVGETTETERAQASSALASAEASKFGAYASMQAANIEFLSYTGLEASDISLPDLPTNLPQTLDEIINKVRIKNFDLDIARSDIEASKHDEGVSKGALLPQVDFIVEAGNNTTTPENAPRANKTGSLSTQVSVNIPIYAQGGAEYSAVRTAKKRTLAKAIALEQTIKSTNANCIANWEAFKAQKASLQANNEAVAAAQIAYDGSLQEEMVGSKNILDVLLTLEKLNSAKVQKVEAMTQYLTAAYTLKQLMGELTAKNMKLKVDYFNPEAEFKKSKVKIIGF